MKNLFIIAIILFSFSVTLQAGTKNLTQVVTFESETIGKVEAVWTNIYHYNLEDTFGNAVLSIRPSRFGGAYIFGGNTYGSHVRQLDENGNSLWQYLRFPTSNTAQLIPQCLDVVENVDRSFSLYGTLTRVLTKMPSSTNVPYRSDHDANGNVVHEQYYYDWATMPNFNNIYSVFLPDGSVAFSSTTIPRNLTVGIYKPDLRSVSIRNDIPMTMPKSYDTVVTNDGIIPMGKNYFVSYDLSVSASILVQGAFIFNDSMQQIAHIISENKYYFRNVMLPWDDSTLVNCFSTLEDDQKTVKFNFQKTKVDGSVLWTKNPLPKGVAVMFRGGKKTSDGGFIGVGFRYKYNSDGYISQRDTTEDGVVIKFSSQGEMEWMHTTGLPNSADQFQSVAEMPNGDILAGGAINGTSLFVVKLHPTGASGVSSETEQQNNGIFIEPNPVSDMFRIQLPSTSFGIAQVKIYSQNGEEVLARNVEIVSGETSFRLDNLSSLSSGVYLVSVNINGTFLRQKFVKM